MTRKITVNRLGLLFIFVMGCHLGRPPAPTGSFAVGQIVASVAEPGLVSSLQPSDHRDPGHFLKLIKVLDHCE